MNYKVVIIGAGPGGAVLARELARKGIEVTIYEKGSLEELGHDWSDAVELESLQAAGLEIPTLAGVDWKGSLVKEQLDGPGLFEKHAVPRLKIFSPGKVDYKEVSFRMITTDRRRLGQMLVKEAVNAGALIYYQREGKNLVFSENGKKGPDGIEVEGVNVLNNLTGEETVVRANLVVESSGFQCFLRTGLPSYTGLADSFRESDFALVHREVRPYNPKNSHDQSIPDHYRYGFYTGYQWTHIHNERSIDVGAGVRYDPTNPDPKEIIEEYISRHPSIGQEKLRGGRSLCIVGTPLLNFVTNGFFVIGDAASTSVPTTGCGVGPAIDNGLRAAWVIGDAARERRSDIAKLWAINTGFYLDSGRGISFAALAALRSMLQSMSHDELDFLFAKDLMDSSTLEDAVNGIFILPDLNKKFASLRGGISNPPILFKLNRAVTRAVRIYKHYSQYPAEWDALSFKKWKAGAEKIMAS